MAGLPSPEALAWSASNNALLVSHDFGFTLVDLDASTLLDPDLELDVVPNMAQDTDGAIYLVTHNWYARREIGSELFVEDHPCFWQTYVSEIGIAVSPSGRVATQFGRICLIDGVWNALGSVTRRS